MNSIFDKPKLINIDLNKNPINIWSFLKFILNKLKITLYVVYKNVLQHRNKTELFRK